MHTKLNFHVNFLNTISAHLPALASAARCGPPHPHPSLRHWRRHPQKILVSCGNHIVPFILPPASVISVWHYILLTFWPNLLLLYSMGSSWAYTHHKKPLQSIAFVESVRMVASTDGSLHVCFFHRWNTVTTRHSDCIGSVLGGMLSLTRSVCRSCSLLMCYMFIIIDIYLLEKWHLKTNKHN